MNNRSPQQLLILKPKLSTALVGVKVRQNKSINFRSQGFIFKDDFTDCNTKLSYIRTQNSVGPGI